MKSVTSKRLCMFTNRSMRFISIVKVVVLLIYFANIQVQA